MAKVKLLMSLSGAQTAARGDTWECGDDEAVRLVEAGIAEPIAGTGEVTEPCETTSTTQVAETADVAAPAETAVKTAVKAAVGKSA